MPEIPTSDNLDPGLEADAVDEDEDFQDAIDIELANVDLHSALNDCASAVRKFFNNNIHGAQKLMLPRRFTSLYHAHGAMIFEFIPALLTLDPVQMLRARSAIDNTLDLYERSRRASTTITQALTSMVKRPNYAAYSDIQAHAELIHAECQLIVACLGAIESDDMSGLLRVSIRIRSAYNSYKLCAKLLTKKTWETEVSQWHFSSGVKLGLATFNVMIAMLPPKIISLLEFVGFSANKEEGLKELLAASELPGLRSVMCRITLLAYYLIVVPFASVPIDFDTAERVLASSLRIYPRSLWFMLFKARMALLQGEVTESNLTYHIVADTPKPWEQIKHLAFWEILWSEVMFLEWENASDRAMYLAQNSKWSTTIYMYLQAVTLLELKDRATRDQMKKAVHLITQCPRYRQRVMGRSLPLEKLVQRRCDRFLDKKFLVLPILEMLYHWNLFPAIAKNRHHSDNVLKLIERQYEKVEIQTFSTYRHILGDLVYDADDRALTYFLRGALLSAMGMSRLALRHLEPVFKLKDELKEKHHVPFALVEAATCHFDLGDIVTATALLNDVKKKYSNYPLESRLLFKIHAKLDYIKNFNPSRFRTG